MTPLIDLYIAQPFWIWLGVGVLLLAVEAAFSTEWLLWPAVSAGVELGIFAGLTLVSTLLSRQLIQRVNPTDSPDINDRDLRLVGLKAQVVEAFIDGRGRVFISGSEWPAVIEGAQPLAGETVIVESVAGPMLMVRAV